MDVRFLYNRYISKTRIVDGYKYRWMRGITEREKWLEEAIFQKGHQMVDVGANVGAWSIPASKYYDEVIAYEPSPRPRRFLQTNLRLNHVRNVHIRNVALGNRIEDAREMHIYERNGQDSFFDYHMGFRSTGLTVQVPIRTLDSERLEPSLVKTDTEGFDTQVIRGGLRTIREHKPVLVVEAHFQETPAEVEELLPEYSFERKLNQNQTWLIGRAER